ncbi:hypothetical protein DSM104299_01218 [Baekduia alba]|uniref:hypothetical protein n=1 Tax=Baekduia alba TaxID=2997333 RepID=UPI0023404A85|nr:hypothetical protein [Baekduia alba]WCB92522.1 hypothetical protein DSM104299_01218 [Baekduia alba]
MSHRMGLSYGVLLLALLCAVSFGAIVRVAVGYDDAHVTCVEHGFYGGGSTTDSSFFARVYDGCSTTYKRCAITSYGVERGYAEIYTGGLCNAWSQTWGSYTECAGGAKVYAPAAFSQHTHSYSPYCG